MTALSVITDVLSLQNLAPNPQVNDVMSRLVNTIVQDSSSSLLKHTQPSIQRQIRKTSAEAETEMEVFWAHQIINAENPLKQLNAFPYIENYQELTARELKLIQNTGLTINNTHRVLIIGSGPLPLSAFEITRQTGAIVDHVDPSVQAITLSKTLLSVLSSGSAQYHQVSGEKVNLTEKYDLILVAALAGETTNDKQNIIDNVLPSLTFNGRIIIRSAKDSRTLLYPAVEADKLTSIQLVKEYHPSDHIINSVLIYERAS